MRLEADADRRDTVVQQLLDHVAHRRRLSVDRVGVVVVVVQFGLETEILLDLVGSLEGGRGEIPCPSSCTKKPRESARRRL